MSKTLGIDLGTTNSVMAYQYKGEPRIVINLENQDLKPSIVGRGRKGELLVGAPAKARLVRDPQNTIYSIKRLMGRRFKDPEVQKALGRISYRVNEGLDGDVRVWLGDHEYTPIEISALILRRMKEDAEQREHERFDRAVITVPAYFGERQVAATREAGKLAGFQVLRILNEPTAAALAYGLNREPDEDGKTILVYDLGGGTFDISILLLMQGAITVMGIEGDNLLGGDDFDRCIIEWILDRARKDYNVNITDPASLGNLRLQAENAKIVLSSQLSTEIIIPAIGAQGVDIDLELTRQEFEGMIRSYLEHTIQLTNKAIRDAHLTPNNIDHILLVGGSTAIPAVEQILKGVFGEDKIRKNVNPMQCVAVGAAVQAALIAEVSCPHCQAENPIYQDTCAKCGQSLSEPDKINCPACFMPSNVGDTTCWKCSRSLSGVPTAPPPPIKPPAPKEAKCPKCGRPYKPGETTCSICQEVLEDLGGLKCQNCGRQNRQGASVCSQCGHDLPVASPQDQTPKPLGIELHDGRMSVIIDKGTNFPTLDIETREFKTAVAGQRRLEIGVFEGFEAIANQNEMCGLISLSLSPNLPNGTPINIGMGLDKNRTITVAVKVRSPNGGEEQVIQLKRGGLDPENKKKVQERHDEIAQFMDRWHQELTEAERADLQQLLNDLESALNQDSSSRQQPLEPLFNRCATMLEQITEIRGTDANVSNFFISVNKYLPPEQRTRVGQWVDDLRQARSRADWTAGMELSREIHAELAKFSANLHVIARSKIWALQDRLSPALTHKVQAAIMHIDQGVDKNEAGLIDQGLEELWKSWEDISNEIARSGEIPPQITKPAV